MKRVTTVVLKHMKLIDLNGVMVGVDAPLKWRTFSFVSFCSDDSLTPEQKLEQALTASRASKPKTVPGLPSYINPAVINPKHFQTIQQKRKLLWGKAKEKEVLEHAWLLGTPPSLSRTLGEWL